MELACPTMQLLDATRFDPEWIYFMFLYFIAVASGRRAKTLLGLLSGIRWGSTPGLHLKTSYTTLKMTTVHIHPTEVTRAPRQLHPCLACCRC
jgi:hypothetical protein